MVKLIFDPMCDLVLFAEAAMIACNSESEYQP
jgi:hypothetical protein